MNLSGPGSFATTRWTLVLAAASPLRSSALPASRDNEHVRALTELCRLYWNPLYVHARRRLLSPADAEDAVQGFFARLLRLESLATVDRGRGRFRAFLLGSFNHYLSDLRDHDRAERRGAHLIAPLDAQAAEAAFAQTPAPDLPPDRAFDRTWAIALLLSVTNRLRDEHVAAGRTAVFETLSPCLAGRRADIAHTGLAAQLGISEAAVRVALHRLRQRYRQLLRDEIAHTVASAEEIEDELRLLLTALSG